MLGLGLSLAARSVQARRGGASSGTPTVVAVSAADGIGTATPAEPTGAAQNDILVAFIAADNQTSATVPTLTVPTGWTQIGVTATSADNTARGFICAIRRGASAPALGFTCAASGSTINVGVGVFAVRGVSSALAIGSVAESISTSVVSGSGSGFVTPATVTTTGTNRMMLHAVVAAYVMTQSTPDNGWTEHLDGAFTGGGTYLGTLDSQLRATAGSTTGRTTVPSAATYFFTGALAIKPS